MTQIDFYILATANTGSCEQFACKLTEKAFRAGHRIYINSTSREQAQQLDNMLWTQRSGSFIPHRCSHDDNDDVPVVIGCGNEPGTETDVLINLADDTPPFFSRFQRVAEIINQDPERKERGRQRFRFYQERGYPLVHHNIN